MLLHKSVCNGNPKSSKCDYYAVPFEEYIQWKKSQKKANKSDGPVIVVEPLEEAVDEDAVEKPPVSSPSKSVAAVAIESALSPPRKRGRPRKIPVCASLVTVIQPM